MKYLVGKNKKQIKTGQVLILAYSCPRAKDKKSYHSSYKCSDSILVQRTTTQLDEYTFEGRSRSMMIQAEATSKGKNSYVPTKVKMQMWINRNGRKARGWVREIYIEDLDNFETLTSSIGIMKKLKE